MEEMQRIRQDWGCILRGVKMSFDFNRFVFAFLGIVISILWILMLLAFFTGFGLLTVKTSLLVSNSLFTLHPGFSHIFTIFTDSLRVAGWGEYAALTLLALGLLAIWSVAGGSITRLTALEFVKNEKADIKESLSFALKKFWSYFWSPIVPLLGVLFFTVCNIFGGLFGQIQYVGDVAVAIGFPLAIISGFFIVFIGIVGVVGFFLMFPAISAEGSDTFDAMSRSYSYVLARPKRFVSLFLGIIICGVIFAFFAGSIACLVMQATFYTVGFGMGQKFESIRAVLSGGVTPAIEGSVRMVSSGSWSLKFVTVMLIFYIVLVKVTVASFVIAYAGSASTISYFILRKDVDGTEMFDVFIDKIGNRKNEKSADLKQKLEDKTPTGKEILEKRIPEESDT